MVKRRVVVYYEETIPAGGNQTIDIAWSCTLRKEGQIADINGDGAVDGIDQGILMSDWGTSNVRSDLNRDGTVDGASVVGPTDGFVDGASVVGPIDGFVDGAASWRTRYI